MEEVEFENQREMENRVSTMKAAKKEKDDSKAVSTPGREVKPDKATERRNKKGYKILEFVRNFGLRTSQKKEEQAVEENLALTEGDKKAKKAKGSTVVKGIIGDFKAAALRFKKKGPAWGQVGTGDAKKQKLSSIKEVLKQKSQPKSK